jgi:hypothetical protein
VRYGKWRSGVSRIRPLRCILQALNWIASYLFWNGFSHPAVDRAAGMATGVQIAGTVIMMAM